MIDHVILAVKDFGRSVAFYAKALKPLGITNLQITKATTGTPI
jgi:catechol 2,3-dioxygenase-like lactoylglutathione lyase family enzyme